MQLPLVRPSPNDYYLKATIFYQMERYEDALEPLRHAIDAAEEPTEGQYQLLYVLQYQTNDQEGMIQSLETLNERWPKEQWQKALEGAEAQQAAADAPLPAAGFGLAGSQQAGSSEYLPIVKVAPVYPPPAAARGIEGQVDVSYTVDPTGTTRDIEIVESSDPVFNNASIESVEKYKYKPRIVDGLPVSVEGVTTRIIFSLEQDR
jgi:TonB family protein